MTTLNDLVEQFNAGQLDPMQKIVIQDGEYSWNIWIKDVYDNAELDRYRLREFEEIGDTWFLDVARIKFKTLVLIIGAGMFKAKEQIYIRDKSQYPKTGIYELKKGADFLLSSIRDDYMEMIVEQKNDYFLLDVDSLTPSL